MAHFGCVSWYHLILEHLWSGLWFSNSLVLEALQRNTHSHIFLFVSGIAKGTAEVQKWNSELKLRGVWRWTDTASCLSPATSIPVRQFPHLANGRVTPTLLRDMRIRGGLSHRLEQWLAAQLEADGLDSRLPLPCGQISFLSLASSAQPWEDDVFISGILVLVEERSTWWHMVPGTEMLLKY